MRSFNRRGPWNEAAGMDFWPDCCKGYSHGRNYGYEPCYYEHYPFYPPYGYDREHDREHDVEIEKEFLEHRLANIREQERYIKERLEGLEELKNKESSQSSEGKN